MVQRPPSQVSLAEMEQRGCAKIGGDLAFSPAWDHAQVEDWLESLFPTLFTLERYLDVTKTR
jgi:hypothetical protein